MPNWLRQNGFHLIILLAGTTLAIVFFRHTQPSVIYSEAPLFDGNQYLKVFHSFNSGEEKSVSFPYSTRIFVPFLAQKYSDFTAINPLGAFEHTNYFFTVLSVLSLFFLWKALSFKNSLIVLGFCWLVLHWTGIVRLNQFDPITVDVPLYFFQTLLIVFLWFRKYVWIIPLSIISTTHKESIIGLLVMLLLLEIWRFWKNRSGKSLIVYLAISIILSLGMKVYLNAVYPPLEESKFFANTISLRIFQVLLDPFLIIRWISAIIVAFGSFVVISLFLKSKDTRFTEFEQQLGALSVTYFLFGLLAGGDILRIVFLGFPFIMTFCLLQLQKVSIRILLFAVISSFPLMKLGKTIPSPVSEWGNFIEWYPEYAPQSVVLFYFGYGVIVSIIAYYMIQKSGLKDSAN